MCPPGTDTAMLPAKIRGPTALPERILSRRQESTAWMPPTERRVVTPESSSVLA